jgi:flagellar basal body-associated protein FliL
MPTIYVLLVLTVTAFVLYVTWRPSSKKSAQSTPKQRPKLYAVRDVARPSKVNDLPTLDFPVSDARGNRGDTRRR